MTFNLDDLARLEAFLDQDSVFPLRQLFEDHISGMVEPNQTYLRHDIDDDIYRSLDFARWEYQRGFRSTYFVLPIAPYWKKTAVVMDALMAIQSLGHEVGLHNDAYHRDPDPNRALLTLRKQADVLRSWGLDIVGCADHGSGEPHNVDLWGKHGKRPRDAGFYYEAYLLQREVDVTYISDNGGVWRAPLERNVDKPTVVLVHPQHWEDIPLP